MREIKVWTLEDDQLIGWYISPELLELSHNAELAYAMADLGKTTKADTAIPIVKTAVKA